MALSESADGGDTPQVVDTLGGRMHLRWDRRAATAHGQLVFFAEYLATTGVFERWVSECTLSHPHFRRRRAPAPRLQCAGGSGALGPQLPRESTPCNRASMGVTRGMVSMVLPTAISSSAVKV